MQGFIKTIVHGAGTRSEHVSCDYSSKCNQERACHNKACRSAGKLALAVFLDTGRQKKDQGFPNVYVKKKSQNKTEMEIKFDVAAGSGWEKAHTEKKEACVAALENTHIQPRTKTHNGDWKEEI